MTEVDGAAGRTFRSFHVPNFRRFFVGQLISQIGNWMNRVTQVLLVLHLTDSGTLVGALTVAQFGPMLLLGAWAGLLADRYDKRRLLLVEHAAAMAVTVVMAGVAFLDEPPIALVFSISLLGGLATALDQPVRRAIIAELVPAEHVQNAVSLNGALVTAAKVLGPAAAGIVIDSFGFGWVFVLDALSYVAVLVALRLVDPTKMYAPPPSRRQGGQIREGLRYAWTNRDLRVVLAVSAVLSAFALNLTTSVPLLVTRSLDGELSDFTALFSVISIGSVGGALLAARRTRARTSDLLRAAAVVGVVSIAFATVPTLGTAFPAAVCLGISTVTFMSLSTTIVQQRTQPALRGRMMAIHAAAAFGMAPVGGPALGAVADLWGARYAVAVGGATAIAAAAWGTLEIQRHDRRSAVRVA